MSYETMSDEPNMAERDDQGTGWIVVGVDGSAASKDALAWAARQGQLTGARVEAVMVWHVPTSAYGAPIASPTDYDFGAQAQHVLEATVAEILGDGPKVEVLIRVVEGHPTPKLLAAADGADLLVVGSRGHGAFRGMLLGSVSAHCITHAPCPVVVVPHRPHPA